jgi:DNA-directed RNA polymerase subunit RPC12/RpoP
MPIDQRNKKDDDDKNFSEELKKFKENRENKTVCPYCSREVELVWLHGHYQCPYCKNIVVGCCGDE